MKLHTRKEGIIIQKKLDVPSYDFLLESLITPDPRYYINHERKAYLIIEFQEKAIDFKVCKIPEYKINKRETKRYLQFAPRGEYYPNILQHFKKKEFKFAGTETWIMGGQADIVLKKKDIELYFEFGPTRATKLEEYLCVVPYFIIGLDNDTFLVIKRGKNFHKFFKKDGKEYISPYERIFRKELYEKLQKVK